MEFFRELETAFDAQGLQRALTIDGLPQHCTEIDKVLSSTGERGEVYCLWGEFRVHRECINGGVRFTLPGCPNVLAWTVTTGLPPRAHSTVIHCTIDERDHGPDFIESIGLFLDALATGLARRISPAP